MIGRRGFLAASGALVVSFSMRSAGAAPALPGSLKDFPELDSWIRVGDDGHITVFTGKAELGQGLRTALLQVAAEELAVQPAQIELVTADTGRTPNEGFTAGSHSMQDSGTALLNAAAQVRGLLTEAAAQRFGTGLDQVTARDAVMHAADGRSIGYGPLAAALSLHVSAKPGGDLTDPKSYRLIGTPMPRVDIPDKVTGGASYVQDMRLPGMLHARSIPLPSPGAVLRDVDTAAIERMPGVVTVVRDGSYLAVVAEREWQAVKAMRALAAAAQWDEPGRFPDQAGIHALLQSLPAQIVPVLNWTSAAAPPMRTIKARYTKPYLSHGSIGPSCAVAQFQDGMMTVWTHTQGVYPTRKALSDLLRLPLEQVRCIHTPGAGCYGHNGADDVAADAALIARAVAGRPVRVQWMREQEHTTEPYGPAMITEVDGSLDAQGRIVDWHYDVWSNSHNRRPTEGGLFVQNLSLPEPLPIPPPKPVPMPEGDGDRNANPLYVFPNATVTYHFLPTMPVRVSAQRGLGAYHNVFTLESFMDELALAAGADPVEFRLRHLQDERGRAVIQTAAERFGWTPGAPRVPGVGRGFAFARYKNLGAYCALALEVSVDHETGRIRIGRVVAAVDSGQPINPDGIRNQIEGGIVQSSSWTLYEQVTFDRHHITSSDWSRYPILRFPAAPESVDVHVMDRPGLPFLGTGEASQGPTGAAIANAVADAVGIRFRDLPLSQARVKAAIGV